MFTPSETKKCLFCSKPVRGRADKKFCHDACRSSYNNQEKAKTNNSSHIRYINNTLFKNRRILEEMLPADEDVAKANQDKLMQKGYVFKYHTHIYTNQKGQVYYYCYDYGFLPLENNRYLIVRRKDE
jgi:predicted nucleic acid-binding Zn ribbon protein